MSKNDEARLAAGCYFDESAAERCKFFIENFCCHSKGQFAGQPFTLLPWQYESLILPMMAWKRKDGTRAIRKVWCETAKKTGKSTLCAALCLYFLMADGEPGAEVYSVAPKKEQASLIFNEALNMVKASALLDKKLDPKPGYKQINFPESRSLYKVLSGEYKSQSGYNSSVIVLDEIHELQENQRELYNSLEYAGSSRRQPLMFHITNAGFDRHSLAWELHTYAERVAHDEIIDTEFLPLIFAADQDCGQSDKWKEEAQWRKACPSLGTTVPLSDYESAVKAVENQPAKLNNFLRFKLTIWTESSVAWIDQSRWRACKDQATLDEFQGKECFAGLDLATKTDTASLCLLFPPDKDHERFHIFPYIFVPEACCEKRQRTNKTRFDRWIDQGHMIQHPQEVIDFDRIRTFINNLGQRVNIKEIAVDRWQASQLANQLMEDGFDVIGFGQGYKDMSEPTKTLEAFILQDKIRHPDNPCLNWMIGNVHISQDAAGNWKADKSKSTEKIDCVIALVMALGRFLQSVESGCQIITI